MAASGAKNGVKIIVALVLLSGAAFVAKQRGLIGGPSLAEREQTMRDKLNDFRLLISREFIKEPERFNNVSMALKLEEGIANPEKDSRLIVQGVVKSPADLEYIKKLIASKEPPVEVVYEVRISPTP